MERINFTASKFAPNNKETTYWIDLNENPYGGLIKFFNGKEWLVIGDITLNDRITKLEQIIKSITEEEYNFSSSATSHTFENNEGNFKFTITSNKQIKVGGEPSGSLIDIDYTIEKSGDKGITYTTNKNELTVNVIQNNTEEQKTANFVLKQNGSNKTIIINITQKAGTVTYEYSLVAEPTSLNFVNSGETKSFSVKSTKQKKINGNNSGEPTNVEYTTQASGSGFSISEKTKVTATLNDTDSERSGKVTVTQSEGDKSIQIDLAQAASEITYEYTFSADPTSLSFEAAGGTKSVTITSKKQKKVNGVVNGDPEDIAYSGEATGTGISVDSNNITAANNATQEVINGSVEFTQNESSKTVTVTVNQAASEA